MKVKHAMVIGGTSGIGLQLVLQLLASGARVAAIGRDFASLDAHESDQLLKVAHNVKDTDAIESLFIETTDRLGGLDLVVFAAGVMPAVESDEYSFAKDLEIIQVNVTGAVAWLDQAASRFQGAKRGCILAIGSVAGDRGRAGQPVYNSSKAFLHTYMEALRNRLASQGVSVVTIKPGPTQTRMTAHLNQAKMMPAEVAAKKILRLVGRQGEFYLSPVHRVAMMIIRHIPGVIFRRMRL